MRLSSRLPHPPLQNAKNTRNYCLSQKVNGSDIEKKKKNRNYLERLHPLSSCLPRKASKILKEGSFIYGLMYSTEWLTFFLDKFLVFFIYGENGHAFAFTQSREEAHTC